MTAAGPGGPRAPRPRRRAPAPPGPVRAVGGDPAALRARELNRERGVQEPAESRRLPSVPARQIVGG